MRDQHLITALIRQLFGEQSRLADRSHFEGHSHESRGRIGASPLLILCSDINLVIQGCLACQWHTGSLLAISDSGPEEWVEQGDFCPFANERRSSDSFNNIDWYRRSVPVEWRSIPWLSDDYLGISAYSGHSALCPEYGCMIQKSATSQPAAHVCKVRNGLIVQLESEKWKNAKSFIATARIN